MPLFSLSLADASCGVVYREVPQPNCCKADNIGDFNTAFGTRNWLGTGLDINYDKRTLTIHIQCRSQYGCDVIALELCDYDPLKDREQNTKTGRSCVYMVVNIQGHFNACTITGYWIGFHRLCQCNLYNFVIGQFDHPDCPPKQ